MHYEKNRLPPKKKESLRLNLKKEKKRGILPQGLS